MPSILIVTNEKNDLIYHSELAYKEVSPLLLFLAYASLDFDGTESFEEYTAFKHRCVAGHSIIIVTSNKEFPFKKFFNSIENTLNDDLMNPHVDDTKWLSEAFGSKAYEIYKKLTV